MALIFTTHHLSLASELATDVALLAGGTLIEFNEAAQFFREPSSRLGKIFRATGNCWPKEDEMDPEWVAHRGGASASASELSDDESLREKSPSVETSKPSWFPTPEERIVRPGGFHWVESGALGGTQWPGLLQEEVADLKGLHALGVKHLVNLTENEFPQDRLAPFGIEGTHFPIVDMGTPDISQCFELCQRVKKWVAKGEASVFHCRAGLGRTGTLLACMRVLEGEDAVSAIDTVRRVNQLYIQSQEQLDFVSTFVLFTRGRDEAANDGIRHIASAINNH